MAIADDLRAGRVPDPVHDRRASDTPGSARLLRGPYDLTDEALGFGRPATSAPNAAKPDSQVVVGHPHSALHRGLISMMALLALKSLAFTT